MGCFRWSIGFALLVAGVYCVVGGASAAEPALPSLGCRIQNYYQYHDDAWTHLPSIGVHYIFLPVPALNEVDSVQRKLAAHGLKVEVLRGEADLSTPDGYTHLTPQLQAAQQLGVKFLFLSPKHPGATKEEACERLRKAGELARQYGVTLTLETHPDLGTNGDEHVATMKRINHPNVRVNFDTGNILYYNKGRDVVEELKKVLPYLATMEIKDSAGEYMVWNQPPIGRGVVDIPGVFRVLKEHGYHGPITMEVEGVAPTPEAIKQRLAGFTDQSREQVESQIAESAKYVQSLKATQ